MKHTTYLGCAFYLALLVNTAAQAEDTSHAQTFEAALHSEQVEGDLHVAIDLYKTIIDTSDNRQLVANSLFQLAQSYTKLGNTSEADKAITRIKQEFSDREDLVAKLESYQREQGKTKLALNPVPWPDGEVLEYNYYNASGNIIIYETNVTTAISGEDSHTRWKKETISTSVAQKGTRYGSMVFDESSNQLVEAFEKSPYDKGVFVSVKDDHILVDHRISGNKLEADMDPDTVNSSLLAEVFRRLTYSADYKETFKLFNMASLESSELSVAVVNDNVVVEVPAGTFETYHIRTSGKWNGQSVTGQELWVSKGEHPKIIQTKTGDIIAKLRDYQSKSATESTAFRYQDLFSMTLPKRWAIFDATLGTSKELSLVLTPFDAHKLSARIFSKGANGADWEKQSLAIVADWDLEWAQGYHKDFVIRDETRREFSINGLPAYEYLADFKFGEQEMLKYKIVIRKENTLYHAFFDARKEGMDDFLPEIKSMVESLTF